MKFAFIAREKATFPIDLLCSVLGVSRAGFYATRRRPVPARRREDQQLAVHVAAAHAASRGRYGSPRVYRELQAQGHEVGRHRVARLMREQGLRARAKRRFQRTTDSQHGLPVAANVLDRQFTATTPNTAWVSDITYLWTREGWLYLVVILDLFSRRIVGALHEGADRGLVEPDDQVPFPVARNRPLIYVGRPLGDQDLRGDELLTAALRARPGHPQRSPRAQTGDELAFERAAALDEQGLIDRFVRYPHGLILGEVALQPVRDLLRAP